MFIEIHPLCKFIDRGEEVYKKGLSSLIINTNKIIRLESFIYYPYEEQDLISREYYVAKEGRKIFLDDGNKYVIEREEASKIKDFVGNVENLKKQDKKVTKFSYNDTRLTKRLNLLITYKLYKDLKDVSRFDGQSINNTINKVLGEYISKRSEDIKDIRGLKG